MLTATQAVSEDPVDALASLDDLITSVEQMPTAPMPRELAVNLFQTAFDVFIAVQNVGIDMGSDTRNVFVTDQINLALADMERPVRALKNTALPIIKAANKSKAATVDIPGYRRLIGDLLKASRRAIEALSAISGFRPRWLGVITGFFGALDGIRTAVKNYADGVVKGIEDAARDEAGKQAGAEARNATFWIKVAAGAVAAAAVTGVGIYWWKNRKTSYSLPSRRLRHR
jgi:hypothetical protein